MFAAFRGSPPTLVFLKGNNSKDLVYLSISIHDIYTCTSFGYIIEIIIFHLKNSIFNSVPGSKIR